MEKEPLFHLILKSILGTYIIIMTAILTFAVLILTAASFLTFPATATAIFFFAILLNILVKTEKSRFDKSKKKS